jgi:hypothetical protein
MPLNSGLIPRELVQFIPSVTPSEFVGVLANASSRNVDFDALKATADPQLTGPGASPDAASIVSVGPMLDAFLFADQALSLNVFYAISGGLFRQVSTSLIAANTFGNISGLRITGRYVRVQVSNASGVGANIELGVYVRST